MADTTRISRREWLKYIDLLSKINDKAAEDVRAYVEAHGGTGSVNRDDLIDYAYGVATKYSEASASLSAEMYDAVAALEGRYVDPAIPADTPAYNEVAKTVNGILKQSTDKNMLGSGIGRLVKRTGVDTTMQNAIRDGAQWAWIPSGDTCAFCITLASRGWQRASKKALKNGHAEHIHSNCDCTYAVRFDNRLEVAGYDPDEYRKMYYGAEGRTPKERINSLRREFYAANKNVVGTDSSKAEEFIISIDSSFSDKAKESLNVLNKLVQDYNSPLAEVERGGIGAKAGEKGWVEIGERNKMHLSTAGESTSIHEFAHTLAIKKEDDLGLSDNSEFWKEVAKVRRQYNKAIALDPTLKISSYANDSIEEFMAEAFALSKMKEMGIPITYQTGLSEGGLQYAQEVLKIIDKYFKRK